VFQDHGEFVPEALALLDGSVGQDAMKDVTALVATWLTNLIALRVPAVGRLSSRAAGGEVPVERWPEGQHVGRSTGVPARRGRAIQ